MTVERICLIFSWYLLKWSRSLLFSLTEKKVHQLEKDLFFYKSKFRHHKELIKESINQQRHHRDAAPFDQNNHQHNQQQQNISDSKSGGRFEEGVTFPPLSHQGRLMESERRMTNELDPRQIDEGERIKVSHLFLAHNTNSLLTFLLVRSNSLSILNRNSIRYRIFTNSIHQT